MKVRNGFVSNSSSSSFVVNVNDLNGYQLHQFMEYINGEENLDGWGVTTVENRIRGFTAMNNGSLEEWLKEKNFPNAFEFID